MEMKSLFKYGDSEHEIVDDIELKGRGELHRFNNPEGVPYSAIYVGNYELLSIRRDDEARMIQFWNKTHEHHARKG